MSELDQLILLTNSILQELDELKSDVVRRNSPWMGMKEAAAYVGLSYSRFSSIYKDRITYSHPYGSNPKFHKKDLDKFLEDSKVKIY